MLKRSPKMIVRANLQSDDIIITADETLRTSLFEIIGNISDPTSPYHIDLEYIVTRLLDCMELALGQEYNPRNCPIIFDAWSCWNSTQPGQIQLEKCPDFVNMGFRAERLAKKVCTEEGEWWVHPDTNRLHKNKLYEF